MLRPTTSGLMLVATAGMAEACPGFGFGNSYLSDYFCHQFNAVPSPRTRAIVGGGTPDTPPGDVLTLPDPEWLTLPEVERAWRSDPAKTLRLIQRIRDAGGRPVK